MKISRKKLHDLINQLPEGETEETGYIYSFMEHFLKKEQKKKLSDIAKTPFITEDKIEIPSRNER